MTSAPVEPSAWSRQRWLAIVTLIMLAQVALILWLSRKETVPPRQLAGGFEIFLPSEQRGEMPGLRNPTLFALPNRHGFSGTAWMKVPPVDYHVPDWSEPPRWLALQVNQLGGAFTEFLRTNSSTAFDVVREHQPQFNVPNVNPAGDLVPTQSLLRVDGDLARRPFVSAPPLRDWPADEILAASEVQIAVDPEGRVFSAVLLGRSGSVEADDTALNLARSARFRPLRADNGQSVAGTAGALSWGSLIFQWHTVAPPTTNSPAAGS